jgi:hypothetical protein
MLQASVRDAAMNTLVEIYRHVGERVRVDLQRKGSEACQILVVSEVLSIMHYKGDIY